MTSPPSEPRRHKLVIVGGVAGGASAATRARRLNEFAEIVLIERGPYISFANCGLPYHIGGEIPRRESLLVQTPESMRQRFNIDVRVHSEVIKIDPQRRLVVIRDLVHEREYSEAYDALVLSPGATPVRPPVPGVDHPRVLTLRSMADMDRIRAAVDAGAKSAVVVGGGFIGLEMVENLHRRGVQISLVELLPQVMPPLDSEMTSRLHDELRRNAVDLHLGNGVQGFGDAGDGRVRVDLTHGAPLEADLALLAVGVRPDSTLAREAGLALTDRGAIQVDNQMRTSDPHIWAVGDCVAVEDAVLGGQVVIPLAGPANREGRIAIDAMCGRAARFRGIQATSIVRVFSLVAAQTGASEKTLRRRGADYRKIYVHPMSHAGYFPGAQQMHIKLLFTPDDGRVLGAQIIGGDGVDKRIDVLAMAVQAGLTVFDLEEVELAYAPQFSSAKDPVNMAGFVAANVLRGDYVPVYAEDLGDAVTSGATLVDVRQPAEFERGAIPGAVLAPLPELRARLSAIPTDKPVIVYCQAGQRGYFAARILQQRGYDVRNLTGGYLTWTAVQASAQ